MILTHAQFSCRRVVEKDRQTDSWHRLKFFHFFFSLLVSGGINNEACMFVCAGGANYCGIEFLDIKMLWHLHLRVYKCIPYNPMHQEAFPISKLPSDWKIWKKWEKWRWQMGRAYAAAQRCGRTVLPHPLWATTQAMIGKEKSRTSQIFTTLSRNDNYEKISLNNYYQHMYTLMYFFWASAFIISHFPNMILVNWICLNTSVHSHLAHMWANVIK